MSYRNNKFKISAPSWSEDFESSDGSYSMLDIQDNFEYIFKKTWRKTDNLSVTTYANKTESRIKFKIKAGYYIELLMSETINLLESTL